MLRPLLKISLVLISLLILPGASAAAQQGGQPIYALVGMIEEVGNARYENVLRTPDGVRYALVGVNADVELEIVRLRDQRPQVQVKVWGTLYENAGDLSRIVVSDILASGEGPRGGETAMAEVAVPVLNVRAGPSTAYARIGQVTEGERYEIVGRSQGPRPWWYLCCPLPGEREGWVAGDLVNVTGDTDAVPLVVVSDPIDRNPPRGYWQVSYFADETLRGAADGSATTQDVDFDWGRGAPARGLPADYFAVRFERTVDFDGLLYQFNARADDGVRLWIDDRLVIDEWHGATGESYSYAQYLDGAHTLRVEYLEQGGDASVRFWYRPAETPRDEWLAFYYDNISLSGDPLRTRFEGPGRSRLQHNWSIESPLPGVMPDNNWSARWEGSFFFDPGDYLFEARVDDGINLYLDGHHLIKGWSDDAKRLSNGFNRVGGGWHTVVVEYYERGGLAFIEVDWYRVSSSGFIP